MWNSRKAQKRFSKQDSNASGKREIWDEEKTEDLLDLFTWWLWKCCVHLPLKHTIILQLREGWMEDLSSSNSCDLVTQRFFFFPFCSSSFCKTIMFAVKLVREPLSWGWLFPVCKKSWLIWGRGCGLFLPSSKGLTSSSETRSGLKRRGLPWLELEGLESGWGSLVCWLQWSLVNSLSLCSWAVGDVGSGIGMISLKSQFLNSLAVWPWASPLNLFSSLKWCWWLYLPHSFFLWILSEIIRLAQWLVHNKHLIHLSCYGNYIIIIYLSVLCEYIQVKILQFVPPKSLILWKLVFWQVSIEGWGSGRESEKSPETGTLVTTRAWTLDMAEPVDRGRDSQGHGNRDRELRILPSPPP